MFWKMCGMTILCFLVLAAICITGVFIIDKVTYPYRLRREKAKKVIRLIIKE